VRPGRAAQRGLRRVHRDAARVRKRVQDSREVVAGPGTDVHDRSPRAGRQRLVGKRLAQPRVVPGGEERLSGLDHLGGIAWAWYQVHVALARDVEGVTLGASQDPIALLEAARAHGAAEQIDGLAEHRGILAAMKVIRNDELRNANNSLEFEGADHGGANVSFFLLDAAPGRGPSLHTHDYAEVFIVLEGQATFRGPDSEREVTGGHVVVVPAGEPHAFVNSGDGPLRQVNIHASPRFVTEWLEEEAYG
jgi:mannose-6-phosphate isomerase-like protein (cupin superfamily)